MKHKSKNNIPAWRPQNWDDALCVVPPILSAGDIPLAIGSHKAIFSIAKDGVSKSSIRMLVAAHTTTKEYHKAVLGGGYRFFISGAKASLIEPWHIERAARYLNGMV